MEPPPQTKAELHARVRQQEVIANLGQRALEADDLDQLMHEASVAVADTLDNDYCKVLELMANGEEVFLRQGVGWREGLVGNATVPTDLDSQAGYTLITEEPVIVDDLRDEERFSGPELLTNHDVVSGISVIIGSIENPWGILGTHTTERREFTENDANFVQSVANILASAIENEQTQRELRESEAKLRMLSENLEEIVWMASSDADEFIYVNPAFEDVWGMDRETLYDDPFAFVDRVHEEDRERVWEAFTTLPEDDFDEEYRIVRPDGEVRWIHARGTESEDEDSGMVRIVGIGEDVTERQEREHELERALDLLDKTERIADVGGWEIDVNTDEVFWTEHLFELLDVDADEEPPLDEALDMYHEEDQPRVASAVEQALASGDPFDVEARIVTDSGQLRWLRLQGIPETVDSEVVSLRGAAQDITERKQREKRLKELIDRLEESNERLEQFAYAASHDLQEPLRMVSSYLQLLERRYADVLDEDGEEYLEFAVDGADRMRDMIDGLLKYSRVETQGDPLEPVDLDTVVADAIEDLQFQIDESDAEITVEPLPRVEGDEDQLRQVLQNLLSNAIEYSGDEPPRVYVTAERDGPEWTVSVRDEGIGIDPADADRIFEVFQRLHSREEHPGTGIGLALSERIVERHGGELRVESEPGEGSTFSFTLSPASNTEWA